RGALGIELEDGARRLGPAHECGIVDLAGAGPLEVGQQRAARVRRDGGERAGTRTEAETMQRQGGLRFRIESHATFATAADLRVTTMVGTTPQSPTAMSRLRRQHAPWRRRASERRSLGGATIGDPPGFAHHLWNMRNAPAAISVKPAAWFQPSGSLR